MDDVTILPKGTLSREDQDAVCGMMVNLIRAGYKNLRVLESHFYFQYRAAPDFKELVRRKGVARAHMIVGDTVKDIARHDKRTRLKDILDAAESFRRAIEALDQAGMEAHDESISDAQSFNDMQEDMNWLSELYAHIVNCDKKDDQDKIMAYVKSLESGSRVSQNVFDKLAGK